VAQRGPEHQTDVTHDSSRSADRLVFRNVPAVTLTLWINARAARTDLGPDTVRVRTLAGTTTLSIDDVAGLVTRSTALGRGQLEAAEQWCRDHGLSFDHEW
jgi:hypothetical protein